MKREKESKKEDGKNDNYDDECSNLSRGNIKEREQETRQDR